MEEQEEEKQLRILVKKHQEKLTGIVAVMGHSYAYKTRIATMIGKWAHCAVLFLEQFIDDDDKKAIVDVVKEDVDIVDERCQQLLVQRAFPRLLRAANLHVLYSTRLSYVDENPMVVIKSRLKSTFELDRLIELVTRMTCPLLIIECRHKNEFRWSNWFHLMKSCEDNEEVRKWYRPTTWNEIEDLIARDRDFQITWERHLQQLIQSKFGETFHDDPPMFVRRLVVDPIRDCVNNIGGNYHLSSILGDAIKYLLTTPQQELIRIFTDPYTVKFCDLRPYLYEKRWSDAESKGKGEHLCPDGECVFKYSETTSTNSAITYANCGVCEKQLVSDTPTYSCRKCTLTLHKLCAERIDFKALDCHIHNLSHFYSKELYSWQQNACKSCMKARKGFVEDCGSCFFQTHLKFGPLPTVIIHDFHPHFLSLYLTKTSYLCSSCGRPSKGFSYRCVLCASFHHLECALSPLVLLKHEHGGHEHIMKLVKSLHEEGMEEEETYWCEVCYRNIDPEAWCYSCQTCPNYVTEVRCARAYKFLEYPKEVKLIPQLQPQLEEAFKKIFEAK